MLLCLPNSIKSGLAISFAGISFFPPSLICIPILFSFSPAKRWSKLGVLIGAFCLLCLILNLITTDHILQRFILSIQFFFPFAFLTSIKLDKEKISILKIFALIAFLFICFQVIMASLGIMRFNSIETSDRMGEYARVGTTAGVATFTGPILLLLFAILILLFKSTKVKILLYFILIISIFLTGTRSALLIVIIATALELILALSLRYKLLSIIFVIIFFPLADEQFGIIRTIESRNQRAMDYSKGDITSGREERWEAVFNIIKANPEVLFTGVGGANTPYFNRYKETAISIIASPHNVFLSVVLEHGIFGLLLFLLILFFMIKKVLLKIDMSSIIFVLVILLTFNTEVIPRSALFASLFFMLYFLICYKNEKQQHNYLL